MKIPNFYATLVAIALFSLPGCTTEQSSEASPETPAEAVQAIIELFKSRDFDALVRTRYAEIGKADGEEQVQALIDKLSSRFGSETKLREVISIYESALQIEPQLSGAGTIAKFSMESRGNIKLSRMADGKWGFHM